LVTFQCVIHLALVAGQFTDGVPGFGDCVSCTDFLSNGEGLAGFCAGFIKSLLFTMNQ